MKDLVVFGAARVDAFLDLPTDKVERLCNLNTRECLIELSYGAKISLKGVQFLLGGNGANVSVGVKRLGVESVLVAEVGTGPLADHVVKELGKEVDITYVSQTEGVEQGFGAIIMYQGERTILSYYSPKQPSFPDNVCGSKWAYLTSTGESFEDYYEKIYRWLPNCRPKLAFNPGGRQIAKGKEWLAKYLKATELIFVNRQEAEKITGFGDSFGKEKELLKSLHDAGPKICVITDGGRGSFVYDGESFVKAGVLPIDSFERTGAGDAFSAGCLAAIIKGKSLEEALLWGTVNSSSVIGYVGPEPGLLKESDLPKWIERAKSGGMKVEKF